MSLLKIQLLILTHFYVWIWHPCIKLMYRRMTLIYKRIIVHFHHSLFYLYFISEYWFPFMYIIGHANIQTISFPDKGLEFRYHPRFPTQTSISVKCELHQCGAALVVLCCSSERRDPECEELSHDHICDIRQMHLSMKMCCFSFCFASLSFHISHVIAS